MNWFLTKGITADYTSDLPLELGGGQTPSTGTLPFTVFLNVNNLNLDGLNIGDVEYKWNFNDNNPPTNGITSGTNYSHGSPQAMQKFLRPLHDNRFDNVNRVVYGGNLSSGQKGYSAAYTYWHNNGGTPFNPTLEVIHQGQVVATATGLSFRVLSDVESTGWITRTVNTNVTGSVTGHFTNIHQAITWINTNRPQGRVKLLANMHSGSDYKLGFSSGIYIDLPDIHISTTGNNSNPCTFFAASGYPTGIPRAAFITLGPNALNFHVSNIYFGNSSGAPFDAAGYGQGSPLTSQLIGLSILSGATNVTVQGCSFRNLRQNIIAEVGSYNVFINNCYSDRTWLDSYAINSTNVIFIGNRSQGIETTAGQSAVIGTGYIFTTDGTSTVNIFGNEMQMLHGTSSTENRGCVHCANTTNVFIEQNNFYQGHVHLESCDQGRVNRNTFVDGGPKASLFLNNSSYFPIVNNVFVNNGGAAASQTCFESSGAGGNNFFLVHNTFILNNTANLNNYEINLGDAVGNCFYANNLIIENGVKHMCPIVKLPTTMVGSFLPSGNIYPDREETLPFAYYNSASYNWNQYVASGLEEIRSRNSIFPMDLNDLWGYKIDTVQNTGLFLTTLQDYHYFINTDFNGNAVTTGTYIFPGAANSSGRVYNPSSTGNFVGSYTVVTRTRPSGSSSSNNYYFNIDDTLLKVLDISGVSSNKRVYGRSAGLNYSTNLFSDVGDYIKTTGTFTFVGDGVDIDITYTNDGPANQSGSLLNSLGYLNFEGLNLGRYNKYVNDWTHIQYEDVGDSFEVNYFKEGKIYPNTKFTPTFTVFGDEYVATVNVLYNFKDNARTLEENVLYRAGASNRSCILPLMWGNENPSGKYLYDGQSLNLQISLRLSRDPARWYNTLYPYKNFFRANYGTGLYFKDPRPIQSMNGVQNVAENLGYESFQYNPTNSSGWNGWANYASGFLAKGFERYMPWALAGFFSVSPLNYPFLVTTPLYDGLSPHSSYPNLTGTISGLINLNLRYPTPILYAGGAMRVVTGWEATVEDIANPLVDAELSPVFDELDIGIYKLKFIGLGLDSIVGDLTAYQQNVLADKFWSRYPGIKMIGEPAICDFLSNKMASFTFAYSFGGRVPASPHYIKDYIFPHAEMQCWLNNNNFWTNWGSSTTTNAMSVNQARSLSKYGLTAGFYEKPNLLATSSGNYLAKSTEWLIQDKPSDVPTLAAPSLLSLEFSESLNATYNINKQYIKLTWSQNVENDFSHYVVYRGLVLNGTPTSSNYQARTFSKIAEFYDTTIEVGLTYYYYVEAFDVYGNKSTSDQISVTFNPDGDVGGGGGGGDGDIGSITIFDTFGYKVSTLMRHKVFFIKR